jgi:microcystin-dependent protein
LTNKIALPGLTSGLKSGLIPLLAAACLLAGAPARACDGGGGLPYVASVCITPWVRTGDFNGTYTQADGRLLAISDYTQLYAVIGETYGSDTGKFGLPNLKGRAAIGAGQSPGGANYTVAATPGQFETLLDLTQLPAHQHTLNQAGLFAKITGDIGSLQASTSLTGLSATTTLSGVSASAALAGAAFSSSNNALTLMAAATGPVVAAPVGKSLGPTILPVYTSASPGVAMASGSISGNLAVTVGANAPVALSGVPLTTIQAGNPSTALSGAPVAYLSGATSPAGSIVPLPTMPPFLALNYYIAYRGAMPIPN